MWYQTADRLYGQIRILWGEFLWGLKPFLWESTTCYTHPLLAASTPDSHFLSLKYPTVQRLRLNILSFDLTGEGKTKQPQTQTTDWSQKNIFICSAHKRMMAENKESPSFCKSPSTYGISDKCHSFAIIFWATPEKWIRKWTCCDMRFTSRTILYIFH